MPTQDLLADLARLPGSRTVGGTVAETPLTPSGFRTGVIVTEKPEMDPAFILAIEAQPNRLGTFADWLEDIGLANPWTGYGAASSIFGGTSSFIAIAASGTTGTFFATLRDISAHTLSASFMEPSTNLTSPVQILQGGQGTSLKVLSPMPALRANASSILRRAEHEDFEFGTSSVLSRSLASLVGNHGVRAIHALRDVLRSESPSPAIMGELLREVGRLQHKASRDLRKRLLIEYLQSPSIQMRHVAATGLAELDDPAAIPALETAFRAAGNSDRLRQHITAVLRQLRDTAACPVS